MLKSLSTIPLIGLTLVAEPLQAIAQQLQQTPSGPPSQWYWHGPWHGSQFWWICPLMMMFMFLVFCAIFIFFRRSGSVGRHHWGAPWHMMDRAWDAPTQSAIKILNDRYARGDIEKEEYEDRKATILSDEKNQP